MLRGVYTSASAMMADSSAQRIVSNNVANLNTPAFQTQRATRSPFGSLLLGLLDARSFEGAAPVGLINPGARIAGVHTIEHPGEMHRTDTPSDLALDGPGFFVVGGEDTSLVTRNGSFQVDADGYLATHDGYRVRAETGYLQVGGGAFTVDSNGTVSNGEGAVGRLTVVDVDPDGLVRRGSNLLEFNGEMVPLEAGVDTEIRQGFVQMSNVDMISELTQLMAMQRSYGANHTALQIQDRTLEEVLRLPEGL